MKNYFVRLVVMFAPLALLAGCVAAGQGAADGGAAGLSDGGGIITNTGGFDGLQGLAYSGSALLAYVVGSLLKGAVRKKFGK